MKKIFFFSLLILLISGLVFIYPLIGESRVKKEEVKKEIAPEFKFTSPKPGEEVKEEIRIKGEVEDALSVEFYLRLPPAITQIYLGSGLLTEEDIWEYSWDTKQNPNNNYKLFAKITNPYGEYFSKELPIRVNNEIERDRDREEKLKEKIKETEIEIEKEEKKITQKEEEIKKEIIKEIEDFEVKKEVEKNIEKTVETIKKEKKLEEEIKEREKEVKTLEKEIKTTQEKIKEIQEVKPKFPEVEKEKIEIVEKIEKEKLESQKEKKENLEREFTAKKEEQLKVKEEKEKTKEKTLKIIKVVNPEVVEEVKSNLENLEKEVLEREKIKIEKQKILLKDSDGDGLSDAEEIRLGTDPFNSDSDNDGFLDGVEYLIGYNPLKPGPADKIVYGDPRKVKPKQADIYKVERVEVITLPTGEKGLKFQGKGLPNSFVTIYIYSYPIVMITKTDGNGNWSIVLDRALPDGRHEVYTTVTNNHGEITARSDAFLFFKAGEKVTAVVIPPLPEKVISPVEALQRSFLILIISLIILAIGIALVIIGISTRKKMVKNSTG